MILLTIGASAKKPTIDITKAVRPAENMLTSISKPALILPSHSSSRRFITYAASGPMIIAPMNMWIWPSCGSPSASLALNSATIRSEPAITPMVAKAPTTAPRSP